MRTMKNKLQNITLWALVIIFALGTANAVLAQDECDATYKKYTDNRKGTVDQKKVAVTSAKEYLEKCKKPGENDEVIAYINKDLPKLEKVIYMDGLYKRFDGALADKKWTEFFASGKEIMTVTPEDNYTLLKMLDVGITLAAYTNPPVDTHNQEIINYAKEAIKRYETGTTEIPKEGISFKTKDDILGWSNYIIGFIHAYRMTANADEAKKIELRKQAVPYLYKSTKYTPSPTSELKDVFWHYYGIGLSYKDDYLKGQQEYQAKYKDLKEETEESKTALAKLKGVADRALDAFARAAKIATDKKLPQAKSLNDSLADLYKARIGKDSTAGMDEYIKNLLSKGMPDPSSPITPIVDAPTTPTSTTGTTTTGTTTTGTTTTTTTSTTTKPTTTTTTTTTTKPTTTTTTTTTTKPTTTTTTNSTTTKTPKKPTPKKKGK